MSAPARAATIGAVPPRDPARWTIIRGAAEGRAPDRAEFARRYASVIRSDLGARWRKGPLLDEIDDAAQEVFLECFRPDGPLARAGASPRCSAARRSPCGRA